MVIKGGGGAVGLYWVEGQYGGMATVLEPSGSKTPNPQRGHYTPSA